MVFFNFNFVLYFFGDERMKRAYFDPLRILKLKKKNVLIISMKSCSLHHKLVFVIMSRLRLTYFAQSYAGKFSRRRLEFPRVNEIIDLEQSEINILGAELECLGKRQ